MRQSVGHESPTTLASCNAQWLPLPRIDRPSWSRSIKSLYIESERNSIFRVRCWESWIRNEEFVEGLRWIRWVFIVMLKFVCVRFTEVFWLYSSGCTLVPPSENLARDGQDPASCVKAAPSHSRYVHICPDKSSLVRSFTHNTHIS